MTLGLVGRKVGMTRVFTEQGVSVPVTVLELSPNRVTQVKSKDTDGYAAVQVTFGQKKANHVNKAAAGHFAKAGVEAGRGLLEFALTEEKLAEVKVGDEIAVSIFEAGQLVDVTGTSKGKGFSGTIKRHNFGAQRTSHGNSRSTAFPVLSVWRRIRVVCSLVSAWQANTAIPNLPFRIWKLSAWMPSVICCW